MPPPIIAIFAGSTGINSKGIGDLSVVYYLFLREMFRNGSTILKINDPDQTPARKPHMTLLHEDFVEKTHETFGESAYTKPKARGRKRASMSNADKTASDRQALYWADCMVRIRDHEDKRAFAEVFEYFAPRVKSFLLKSGTDAVMAEECAQETLVTVWCKCHQFNPARAALSTWIFTIARNKRIDVLRRENRPEPDELPWGDTEEPPAEDILEINQETERVASAVKELPDAQRIVVERAFYAELSHQEIANETGLPLGTIKSRIRLALERLRHTMK